MVRTWQLCTIFLGGLLTVPGCSATGLFGRQEAVAAPLSDPAVLAPPAAPAPAANPNLPALASAQAPWDAEQRPLPINLPAALQLANVRAVDVAAAAERIRVAAAVLEQAQVLWLPSITFGADYLYHAGPIQDVSNAVFNNSHSGLMLGAGSGIGNAGVISVNDAIFAPLAARQLSRARQADLQSASNDTLVAVSEAYFTVQQARGELAGAMVTIRHTEDLLARTRKLAPEIVPDLELFRAETELASREKAELMARQRWRVAGAELLRVLRMDPTAQVEPLEPPHLRVELIDLNKSVLELVPVALKCRPELASQQAMVEATLAFIQQERWRPFLPYVLLRGASTSPGGTLAAGAFFPNPGGSGAGGRGDVDVQLLWQLDNLGFGNRAKVHQREAESRAASVEFLRIKDRVAADVVQAHVQAQLAARRVKVAERGLQFAVKSVEKNLFALKETKGAGAAVVLLVRPQEVVAAIQALSQAYSDYYAAVSDANRAQFRLYRALGQPAEYLARERRMAVLCAPDSLPSSSEGSTGPRAPEEAVQVPLLLPPQAIRAGNNGPRD